MATDLEQIWRLKYAAVPAQLQKIGQSGKVATAFNANIDAVVKISGAKIAELAKRLNILPEDIAAEQTFAQTPADILRGIIKCFISGNAEEWPAGNADLYVWLKQNIGYERLQMGGQGGIVANAMAVLGVPLVVAHSANHPKLQAEQFLPLSNLFAVDENARLQPAHQINRPNETPLIHWIIEFERGDSLNLNGRTYICPKANRFIASYDPANFALKINDAFVRHINENGYDYLVLSGFHGLSAKSGGQERISAAANIIRAWKQRWPLGIIHLETASTQDKIIRREIIEKIAPLVDSLGLNDREALEILQIINPQQFAQMQNRKLSAAELFDVVRQIKQTTKTPRLQLHMFGLYLTLQNKNFAVSPEQNRHGMLLAATVAASKAGLGKLETAADLLWAHQNPAAELCFDELKNISSALNAPQLLTDGISTNDNIDIIAVPTIIIAKPRTLVGMGDTISSVSLVGAR